MSSHLYGQHSTFNDSQHKILGEVDNNHINKSVTVQGEDIGRVEVQVNIAGSDISSDEESMNFDNMNPHGDNLIITKERQLLDASGHVIAQEQAVVGGDINKIIAEKDHIIHHNSIELANKEGEIHNKDHLIEDLSKQMQELQMMNEQLQNRIQNAAKDQLEQDHVVNTLQVRPHIPKQVATHLSSKVKPFINEPVNEPVKEPVVVVETVMPMVITSSVITTPVTQILINSELIGVSLSTIQKPVKVLTFIKDLSIIVVADSAGYITFLKYPELSYLQSVKGHEGPIKCVKYVDQKKILLSGGIDGKLNLYDSIAFTFKTIGQFSESVRAIACPTGSSRVFIASGNKIIEFDMITHTTVSTIEAHEDTVTDLVYCETKGVLISCSEDTLMKIWDPLTRENMGVLEGHSSSIKSICIGYTNNHTILASIGLDSVITFWNLDDKNLTKSFGAADGVNRVFYLHDKRTFCTLHNDSSFYLWDIERDENVKFVGNKQAYLAGYSCQDGKHFILGADDGSAQLWKLQI